MIFDANVKTKFWAEACNSAAYIMNRTPRALLNNRTPEEKWSGKRPDVSQVKIFGSEVLVHTPREKRTKWQPKSKQMMFIGFDDDRKGYRCFDEKTNKVIVSRDVIFFESSFSTVKADISEELLSTINTSDSAFNADDDTDNEELNETNASHRIRWLRQMQANPLRMSIMNRLQLNRMRQRMLKLMNWM